MITDTCCCGAKFTTNQKYWLEQSNDHKFWLESHAICRQIPKPDNKPYISVKPPTFIEVCNET